MQYDGYIEGVSDFVEKVKNFRKKGVLLGVVVGSFFDEFPDDADYYDALLKSNGEIVCPMNEFFQTYSPEGEIPNPKEGKITSKYWSQEIYNHLNGMDYDKMISDDQKKELVKLINRSAFTKFGIMLENHYNYAQLSSCTLQEFDAELYKIFATDPRFAIRFEHVLRYYRFYSEDEDQTPEIEENVYRFNYFDYMALQNDEQLLKADPDLRNVPFFQLGHGKRLFKFQHLGGSSGRWYFPEQTQSIEFHAVMFICKVQSAMPCEMES